ncbi:MAG: hypothetical protein OCD76_25370 [Reichenbachiella sp.]
MKQITLSLFLFGAAFLYGCYPNEITSTEELDIVLTEHIPSEFESHSFQTYYIPDTVGYISNDDKPAGWDATTGTLIRSNIINNMDDLGYIQVPTPEDAHDLLFLPEVILVDNYVVGGGGCWYWYYYYPYCGGYYPPYWGYSYSTGTIMMNILNRDNIQEGEQGDEIIWTGIINGLMRSNGIPASTITQYIDQTFTQSEYLEVTGN